MDMKEILKGTNQHLKLLWHDKATIYRNVEVAKENGATGFEKQIVYENISCHYSQKETTTNQTESNNLIEYTHKLFYDVDIDIQTGDEIVITIKDTGITRTFVRATEPVLYFGHNEVNLMREDIA